MYELPHELPHDLRIRILGNKEINRKTLKCLDLMASTPPTTQKLNFDVFDKISQKISSKTFYRKSILLSFVNLSTTFCLILFSCPILCFDTLQYFPSFAAEYQEALAQETFTCSKSTVKAPEKGVKYVQS